MTGALWEFTPEMAWLLRSTDYLFEACERPGGVYGCKGCGNTFPRSGFDTHLSEHRASLGAPERAQAAPPGVERSRVGLDDLPDYRQPTVNRIIDLREQGASYPKIAEALNADETPTFGGGQAWYPVTVRALYLRHTAEAVPA